MPRSVCALLSVVCLFGASDGYLKPPQQVLDVLNAPDLPALYATPGGTHVLLAEVVRYPSIAEVARPWVGLAGVRVHPDTNSAQSLIYITGLKLKELATGKETQVALPAGAKLSAPVFSPDGKLFAIANSAANSVELLIGDVATAKVRAVPRVALNTVLGPSFSWTLNHQLLARTVRTDRGKAPTPPAVPPGPVIQESQGQSGPVRTNPDMIDNPYEEDLFDYFATTQLAIIDAASGRVTPVGSPAVIPTASLSPDGKSVLVTKLIRPYSYLHPWRSFAHDIEVWDRSGKLLHKVASLPAEQNVPIGGVSKGPRYVRWFATEPSTVIWTEALDGGDPRKKVEYRDRLMRFKAPFQGEPVEVARTAQRMGLVEAIAGTTKAVTTDYDRDKRWLRTLLIDLAKPGEPAKVLWGRNERDRYRDEGRFVQDTVASGQRAILQRGGYIYLEGSGATPKGERPFLRKLALDGTKPEKVFQSGENEFTDFVALAADDGSKFIIKRETPTEPPNYYMVSAADGKRTPITNFTDPTPQLRRITKQLVRYKRKDGVDLQFTLYLPPDYKPGTRLPTIIYAYPYEYNDPEVAGQVTGSTQRFTTLTGYTHLFCVLAGYAVLDQTAMPVVGDPETVNNTYVQQITDDARAAIAKAAEMGVTDPNRVGVIGHSYGAFMTANLLAHTDLFRAGVARSGAYNRTLTPFGFQSERRTYWEAKETYLGMSPFHYANQINEPILFIHGQADDNQGTFTVQSERMYQAVRGNGGTTKLVLLPHEAHGYRAKETTEHVLYETIAWFDKYVKNAPAAGQPSGAN